MAHNKLLSCHYDEVTGRSYVIRGSQYGAVLGTSQVFDEDKDIQNRFDGCRIADYRCMIEIQKRKVKELQARYRGALEVWNALPYEDDEVMRQVNVFKRRAKGEKERLDFMKEDLKKMCEESPQERRKFREKYGNIVD